MMFNTVLKQKILKYSLNAIRRDANENFNTSAALQMVSLTGFPEKNTCHYQHIIIPTKHIDVIFHYGPMLIFNADNTVHSQNLCFMTSFIIVVCCIIDQMY